MGSGRYVVVGLANVRSFWFREVGRWATAAAIPVDFVKCVSVEELRARLGSGRSFSAVLLDAGLVGIDRDLLDLASDTGAAVLVVGDGRTTRDWVGLGATAVLPESFQRHELMDELDRHGRLIERAGGGPATAGEPPASPGWSGRLLAVTGGAGAGSSTLAMALAQGLGDDPRYTDLILLADLALRADLAMLHDARDVVPGLQELVDAHRSGSPTPAEVRATTFAAPERGYRLLLGLRRPRDWSVLRPRALAATVDSLLAAHRLVVADIEAELDGEDETGSVDIEERNSLARTAAGRADLVVAVGNPTVKGVHDLVRVIADLVAFGVDPARLLPVVNRSGRSARQRSEITAAFGELVAPISTTLPSPLHLPERRRLDDSVRDGIRLHSSLSRPLAAAVAAALKRLDPRPAPAPAVPVTPGSLGRYHDDLPAEGTG